MTSVHLVYRGLLAWAAVSAVVSPAVGTMLAVGSRRGRQAARPQLQPAPVRA